MKTLQINTSIFGAGGQSTQLADRFASGLGGELVVRDLAKDPVPHLDAQRFGAFLAKPEARSPAQRAVVEYSDQLIGELRDADTVVLALPMYNFGVPSTLRAYFDHIARAGVTFKYTEKGAIGLLTGKRAYVFVARGGMYGDSHAHSQYVRDFLAFVGIADVTFVYAEGLAMGDAPRAAGLANAHAAIQKLRHDSLIAA
jgi:FMN-dependent NADH-azoreductase